MNELHQKKTTKFLTIVNWLQIASKMDFRLSKAQKQRLICFYRRQKKTEKKRNRCAKNETNVQKQSHLAYHGMSWTYCKSESAKHAWLATSRWENWTEIQYLSLCFCFDGEVCVRVSSNVSIHIGKRQRQQYVRMNGYCGAQMPPLSLTSKRATVCVRFPS